MNVSIHFLTSLILTALFYPFFGLNSLWIFVGGFLIDFDHYLYYVFKFKNLSVKKAYYYHVKVDKRTVDDKDLLHLFHTVEFWIFMILVILITLEEVLQVYQYLEVILQ